MDSATEQQYHQAHEVAEQLMRSVKDLIDDNKHPEGQALLHETHQLAEDLESKKNPRSVEDGVKAIIKSLKNLRREGDQVMDFRHIDYFIKSYEQLRQMLRTFGNY
jgi:uncharacterized protein YoxC